MKKQFTKTAMRLGLQLFAGVFAMLLISEQSWGQVNISAGNTITENFTIGTSATATLPSGWKVDKNTTVRTVGSYSLAGTATEQRGGNSLSSTATNGIYNFAAGDATSATDRALGGLSSSTASKSVNVYVQLTNNGSSNISGFTISYSVEKYRNGSNPNGFSIQMYYSTDGTNWTSAGNDFLTSFGADADNNGYASAPGSTVSITSKSLNQSVAVNSSIYLAWNYSVTSGTTTSNAQALGIDDVSITALGSATPTITVSTASLTGFTYAQGAGPSIEQTFTVSGANLTNNISIAPFFTNYEISKTSGSGYTTPLTFTPAEVTTPQTVYVRLKAGLNQGNYNNEDINITSTGATSKTVSCSGTVTAPLKPEPTNHATSFQAATGAPSYSAITLSWTDATGGTLPDGYLIKGSSIGYNSITAPTDGTAEADGALVKNITQGTGTYQFTGLNDNTQYYFKIYPYTNSGSSINYKTDGSVPEATATTDVIPWIENFESGSKTSYTAGNVTCTKGSWSMTEALIGTSESDRKNGSQSIRMRYSNATIYGILAMNFDKTNGAGTVTINHAKYGTDVNGTWKLQMSVDAADTWVDIGNTIETSSTTLTAQNFNVNQSGYVRFRIVQLSGYRINIDDIIITDYAASNPTTSEFTGSFSNAWEITANWNNGNPTSTTNVTIPAGKTVEVNTTNNFCNNLTIESTGALTVNTSKNLSINGTLLLKSDANGSASFIDNGTVNYNSATAQRYLTGNVFHQLGLPISNTINAGTNAGQTGDVFKYCTLDSYNEATNDYVGLTAASNVTPDKGYVVKYTYGSGAPAYCTLNFTGTLNTGTVNIPMTKDADGYNLIPNPYPSSIDWNAATGWSKNVDNDNTTYIWNTAQSQFATYNGTAATNGGSRYIAPGQAFFIKADNAGNITMTNNIRVHNATSYLKSSNEIADNLIKIKVNGDANSISDETVVYFANNPASLGSEKWFSYETIAPSLYTIKNNKNYAINVLSDANTSVTVPMAFKPGANGNYTLNATEIGNFVLCSSIILEDTKNSHTQNILANPTYNFTATTNDNANRFILHFATAVGVNNIDKTNTAIYAYNNNIYINGLENINQINVYNTLGQLIKTINNVNGLQKISMNNNSTGYYIVKVITDSKVYSEKVWVK